MKIKIIKEYTMDFPHDSTEKGQKMILVEDLVEKCPGLLKTRFEIEEDDSLPKKH